jgi:hypothetical protein
VAACIKFLWAVHNLTISGNQRPELYLDDTWVNQNHPKNTSGRTHKESEASEFLQVKGAALLYVIKDRQEQANSN